MSVLTRGLRDAVLTAGFATMGAMKLTGAEWEVSLFRKWGQSDDTRTAFGAMEAISALLLLNRRTRRLGAASMAIVSVPTLLREIDGGEDGLAIARFALLGMAVSAATDPIRLRGPSPPKLEVRRQPRLPAARSRLASLIDRVRVG